VNKNQQTDYYNFQGLKMITVKIEGSKNYDEEEVNKGYKYTYVFILL